MMFFIVMVAAIELLVIFYIRTAANRTRLRNSKSEKMYEEATAYLAHIRSQYPSVDGANLRN